MKRTILGVAAVALLAAGCSASPGIHVTSGASNDAPAHSGQPATPQPGATPSPLSGNALVCQHYRKQYKWKLHLTYPTMADAIKWETYVAADAGDATGKLGHDLNQEYDAMAGKPNTYKNGTVAADCGITH